MSLGIYVCQIYLSPFFGIMLDHYVTYCPQYVSCLASSCPLSESLRA